MLSGVTGAGKALLGIIFIAAVLGALWYFNRDTKGSSNITAATKSHNSEIHSTNSSDDDRPLVVTINTWGGWGPGIYYNNGLKATKNSKYFTEQGIQVEFKLIDDFQNSREAWKAGDVDVLWATLDAFTTEAEGLKQFEPQVFMQADWSFGGDAIVVERGINQIGDLKGKTIALAPMTPSHSFLLWALNAGDLKYSDVQIKEVQNAIDAADLFKKGQVDAAVCWSPDDQDCITKRPGSKILVNTKSASNIIADCFLVKKSFLDAHQQILKSFATGWFKAIGELKSSVDIQNKTITLMAEAFSQPEDFCKIALFNARLTNYGDNINFFNIKGTFTGITAENLYNHMVKEYMPLGYTTANTPSWRNICNISIIRNLNLPESEKHGETPVTFSPATEQIKTAPAISNKKLSITFSTGSYTLDDNAKTLIDESFVPIAEGFARSRIRIEGNTDNVGNPNSNIVLSEKRAQSVANYLAIEHGFDKNRFIVLGNGINKPIADNNSENGRRKNRRTDFQLINE